MKNFYILLLYYLFINLSVFSADEFKKAIDLQNKKEYKEAQIIYKKLLEKEYKNSLYWNNLGFCQQSLSNFKLAEKSYLKALQYAPSDAQIYNNFASLRLIQNDEKEAERLYLEAINKDADYPFTYNNLATLYKKQNKLFKAIEFYKQAIDRAGLAEFYYNLGLVYFDMKKYDDMLETFQKALSIEPNYSEVYYSIAFSHYYNLLELPSPKRKSEFKKAYNKLNTLNPKLFQKLKKELSNN